MTSHHHRIFALRHDRSAGFIRKYLAIATTLGTASCLAAAFLMFVTNVYTKTAGAAREQVPHRIAAVQFEYFTAPD